MKQTLFKISMMCGVALATGAMGLAQARTAPPTSETPTTPTNGDTSINSVQPPGNAIQDKDFVHEALEGGMAEVQMGQLAAQKASSDDVKQFGQKMVQDHTQMTDQIKQVAQQLGVSEPKGLSKKDKAEIAKLNSLSGPEFDKAYIAAMVKDHKKDLSDFRAEAQNTQDPTVKQAAQQGAQVIDQHLQMIEQIAKVHNVKA